MHQNSNLLYPAFGSVISEMQFSSDTSSKYRYGFNNQEKDGELGDYYAFEYRIHDARLGRFLSVDPLTKEYPWNSPYAFAENDVIRAIDLEGSEKVVMTLKMAVEGGKTIFKVNVSIDYSIKTPMSTTVIYKNFEGNVITSNIASIESQSCMRIDILRSRPRNHAVRESNMGRGFYLYTSSESIAPNSSPQGQSGMIVLDNFTYTNPFSPIQYKQTTTSTTVEEVNKTVIGSTTTMVPSTGSLTTPVTTTENLPFFVFNATGSQPVDLPNAQQTIRNWIMANSNVSNIDITSNSNMSDGQFKNCANWMIAEYGKYGITCTMTRGTAATLSNISIVTRQVVTTTTTMTPVIVATSSNILIGWSVKTFQITNTVQVNSDGSESVIGSTSELQSDVFVPNNPGTVAPVPTP